MNYKSIFFFLAILSIGISCSSSRIQSLKGGEVLFDKASPSWTTSGEGKWNVENQIITGTEGMGYAVTTKTYGNFIMEAEFMPSKEVNSGVFIRCPKDVFTAGDCYEVNIWDEHTNQEFRTGSIVTHGKPLKDLNSVGKWNTYKISAIGNHIQVWLNGELTADLKDSKTSTGYIALQIFGEGMIKLEM